MLIRAQVSYWRNVTLSTQDLALPPPRWKPIKAHRTIGHSHLEEKATSWRHRFLFGSQGLTAGILSWKHWSLNVSTVKLNESLEEEARVSSRDKWFLPTSQKLSRALT